VRLVEIRIKGFILSKHMYKIVVVRALEALIEVLVK